MAVKKTYKSICLALTFILFTACAKVNETGDGTQEISDNHLITVGFSQVGAESDWRRANTESMKAALSTSNGYDLIFMDGQQKQTNQIMAIRRFIQQEVDYIVLAPVKEEGFNTVLREAKDAGIPVIIVDRMVEVTNESIFRCFVGSDFELEGRKMVEWLNAFTESQGIAAADLRIVNVQGTAGSSAQLGRSNGLEEGVSKYSWTLLDAQIGDYTQTKGKEVMIGFLEKYPDLNVVYCENDNMAFGVIEAIEEAGKNVGTNISDGEILVLSFDGVSERALELVREGKIACIGECNPLHGPRVSALIESLERGETIEKISYVDESMFAYSDIVPSVTVDGVEYKIESLN